MQDECRYSLGLALADKGRLAVEVATGPGLSPFAGAFVLERFIAFVNDAETMPSAFPAATPCDAANDLTDLVLEEFRRALGRPDMGPDDDFFDLGGHSLIATRVIGRLLGEHRVEVQFNDLFGAPTAAGLARLARRQDAPPAEAPAPSPAETAQDAPLTLAQTMVRVLRWRPEVLIRTGAGMAGLAFFGAAFATTATALYLCYFAAAAGMGLLWPSVSALAANAVEPHEQGGAAGTITAAQGLGSVVGPLLGTAIYAVDITAPYVLIALLLAVLIPWRADRPANRNEQPQTSSD